MRNIWVYYNDEDGKILAYSAREDPNFLHSLFILVPLDDMRKFYDGKDSINFYEVLNQKLQKKDDFVYDESYINDNFFEVEPINIFSSAYRPEADFRVVSFKDCVVIFPCDIDCENPKFRAKLENTSVWFYFTKKDDPSILYKKVTFDGLQTSLTVVLEEDFTIFVTDPTFTYSLEFADAY